MTMQQHSNTKPNGSPAEFLPKTITSLDQVEDALAAYKGESYVGPLLDAITEIRRAVPFTTRTAAVAAKAYREQTEAVSTATQLAQSSVPVTGFKSPADRAEALAGIYGKTVTAFWEKVLSATLAEREDQAKAIAEDAREALERASARLDLAAAKFSAPLSLRIDVDADLLARLSLVRDELEGERPTAVLALWDMTAKVQDLERLDMLALALLPLVIAYREKPGRLSRFRMNIADEKKAVDVLFERINERRAAAQPEALVQARAAYRALVAIWNSTFARPSDQARNALDKCDPSWLRRAASVAAPR